jgi:EpsI family protein
MDRSYQKQALPTSRLVGRRAVIGGILACASGLAYARQPEVIAPILQAKAFEALVPEMFGDWNVISRHGLVLPPPDTLRDRLYDNLVTRVYQKPDTQPVMLLLAYNNEQNGVVQVHRPEVCYPVGGFELSETQKIEMSVGGKAIPANIFTAESSSRTEQVIYFTRLGNAFPRSWIEQRISVMKANLAGEIPDGMMMRVSVLEVGQQQAKPLLTDFTREFINASPRQLQKLLVG